MSLHANLEYDGLSDSETLLGELVQKLSSHGVSVVVLLSGLLLVEEPYVNHLESWLNKSKAYRH